MEQGGMERGSRLPCAPSRLPMMSGGTKVQVPGPPSGLPRLFGRNTVQLTPSDLGQTQIKCEKDVNMILADPQAQDLTEEEEREWESWIGKRVCISGIKKGTLMYFGKTLFAEGLFCGISLDEAEGRHDGSLNGHRYFNCPDKHGVFAPSSKVEKVLTPRLPAIPSSEDLNRTFVSGAKSPCSMNNTFVTCKSSSPFGGGLNSTFVAAAVASPTACNGVFNSTFVAKSQSFASDLDRTYSLKESPTSTYPLVKHHNVSRQRQSGHQTFLQTREDSHLECYDEDESSLGLLTDSQMGDLSLDGLILIPKTQSCDDINELPEHEVVQDITVQYLDETISPKGSIPVQSTPLNRDVPCTFTLDSSLSEDRSFSLLENQELPSGAYDFTLGTVAEDKGMMTVSSSDDTTQSQESAPMPEEEALTHPKSVNQPSSSADTIIHFVSSLSNSTKKKIVKTEPVSEKNISSEFVNITTATGECVSVSKEAVIGALVSSIPQSCALPEDLLTKLSSSILEKNTNSVRRNESVAVTTPTDVQLLEKGQRSLESSLTKSVEWNDVVMVQRTEGEFKEERMSIEKVMEVIQAKGASGQRPASTYTVGSADTGYQGDAEFDMQSELETSSPCEELKALVSPSVSTSMSLEEMTASAAAASSKMGKSGHLSDSDFFTEDPGEAEGGTCTPPVCREDAEQPSESVDGSVACASVADETLVEQHTGKDTEQGADCDIPAPGEMVPSNSNETGQATETMKEEPTEENIPKKSKKLPHSGPIKKVVGVSKIKALMESAPPPPPDLPKRVRAPKKSRWDAVTSKIQAGMQEEKVKPRREVKGRVNTNLVGARVPPAPCAKKTDLLGMGKQGSNEGVGSAGPASTRSTPVTESFNLPADGDETLSQATTSARDPSPSACSSAQCSGTIASSTASAFSSTSSQSSVLSSIPSTSQPPHKGHNTRLPSKIAIRLQPRLDPVAKVGDLPRKSSRAGRGAIPKTQKVTNAPASIIEVLHGTAPIAGVPKSVILPPTVSNAPKTVSLKGPGPIRNKYVTGCSPSVAGTPTTPQGGRPPVVGSSRPAIRSALANPLVIPSSSRQQRQKLEELGREVQHLGALCETRTKELNRVKMQLKHAASGFDAFATLVQYLAGELNAFSHPDLVSEIQTTKEQLITLENFLRQCEGDLEGMRERHAEEVSSLTRQLQQAQQDTAQLQEKLENAEQKCTKQCEDWEVEKERLSQEAASRQQAALELTQAQHASQIQALLDEHSQSLKACEERHQVEQELLKDQLEIMKERCRELQEQARSIEEALQKDTDTKIQWLSSKNADLQKEVESLKSVLEMKQGELHSLRKENQIVSKQAEELPVYRHRVNKLMSRIEELQALLREKSKNERKLSCDQRSLQEHLDKESKINRQLSMEKEELIWRLSQSFNSSTGSLNNSSFMATPEFLKKKRPSASTPFRLTPGSLPPFKEGSFEESPEKTISDENSIVSSSTDLKPYRARVRVNRTRSCHTSPRNSPSHNTCTNSRMVASTPNMPCDDVDEASSSKLSPCDSLTELHLKACMQLDCIDDLLLQQKQQDEAPVFSPNGASSGSGSMSSSAAEDLSLSSTEEERRHENLTTSPRSQAGEAMTTVDREAMVTPDSPPGETMAAPSDNNLSDTPCFCDDFDISSEPE